ncbi:DUF4392 domain-containing protein [Fusibacter ferrireducens]|uniref:DUF4392 domain-containing protein n=1 Tax=Fusibacter ferrireducens TaxID=2785058 RepID=A0ABR9ZX37_9FIRM|nr:DUF4392 domain-containing protein [Fusibacter ferrireducens]MBF4694425.1 DUF4392 domain-containing protein [Fusibacter ferrireducens]
MNQIYYSEIDKIIGRHLENRGMDRVQLVGETEAGAKSLYLSKTVMIVTGFVIRDCLTGETDGPLGAIALASALEQLGKCVVLVTDVFTERILRDCCRIKAVKAPIEVIPREGAEPFCDGIIQTYKPTHIVAIERPGMAQDGHYYSMRGEDLSDMVSNADHLFINAKRHGIVTLAVGDGGNEIGMGKVAPLIHKYVKKGAYISAVTSADYLVVAGVSNWGGHALAAVLSMLEKKMLLHDCSMETQLLEAMVSAGAVDGCTKQRALTVDGLSLEENLDVLEALRRIVKTAFETYALSG